MTLYDRITGFPLKIENTIGGPRKRHEEQYDRRLEYRDDVTVIWMQVGIRDDAATRVPRLPAAVSFRIGVRKSKTEC